MDVDSILQKQRAIDAVTISAFTTGSRRVKRRGRKVPREGDILALALCEGKKEEESLRVKGGPQQS